MLDGLGVPVLVVWGEKDRILPVEQSEGLPDGVKVLRLPDAGHLPHMERAAEVNEAIKAHLAGA